MNILRLVGCGLMAMLCLNAAAVPAKPGMRTITQADGSTITVRLVGDEFAHTYVTADGLPVTRQADGNFYYITTDGVSPVVAHDAALRSSVEKTFLSENASKLSSSLLLKQRRSSARKAPARVGATATSRQVPCIGSPRVPIILVQYKDVKFKDADAHATFAEFFSEGKVSAHQYFVDQSNGLYTPQFDVYGPFTLPQNRSYYGGNDYRGDDKGLGEMVADGCLGLDSQIDFSRYDNDGDGVCDVAIVLYAGVGEASSDEEDAVWPCQWSLRDSEYGKPLTLDGTVINKFAVFNELNGYSPNKIDGIGTFCHEFSHCLELPDFYDTNYGPHFGMGDWSLMDQGSYNDDGYTPIGYSAYEKEFMGWIEVEEATENTFYTLPAMNLKSAATDKAVRITNAADPNEYYILENRRQQGWDEYMPAEGLMISHVTYKQGAWEANTVNDYDLQRMTIIPADGRLKLSSQSSWGETYYYVDLADEKGDLWPFRNANELTDTSTPAATVNTGSLMHKPVTEITRNADGTVSFWIMKAPLPLAAAPTGLTHKVESPTAVTVSWTAGDDNDVTYTLEIRQHQDIELLISTVFTNGQHGWAPGGYTETSTDGIRMGSNKNVGSVTSPAFHTNASGIVTLRFNAKSYGTDGSSIRVSLLDNSGNSLGSKDIELGTMSDDYVALFNTDAEKDVKIKCEAIANRKRVYLYQADIYLGDASDLSMRAATQNPDATYRSISGLTETGCRVDGLLENGTFDYRVKAVPVDNKSLSDSPWTAAGQFTLGDTNSVTEVEVAVPAEYYTLQGLRLTARPTAPGIYIERRGSQARKVIIKSV